MKLIIQIPCYNEAGTLEIALNDLPKHIDGIDEIEYLIINDGSKDETVEVARRWGVNYVVNFTKNRGLAKGFMAGLDACLRNGADIIVNTDADNQYSGADIETIVRPILEGKSDIVIGARPIDQASQSEIQDAPSGFRAISREAALRMNVTNEYTYTLETIVQAGRERIPQMSIDIHTNAELRPSRLFSSIPSYVKKSMVTIFRAYAFYKPLRFFITLGSIPLLLGFILGVRYLVFIAQGTAAGHIQSLILASILIMIGFMTYVMGILADTIAATRKILEDVQYHARRTDYQTDQKEQNK